MGSRFEKKASSRENTSNILAVYDTLTATSSTKKADVAVSAVVVAIKVSVTVCPAYLDSKLVALKVICCQLWVALESQ